MSASTHIVIIGAGLIGLSCADVLLARGVKVTILEARDGPVRGTSFSNSGMIHPSQSRSWAPDLPDDPKATASVLFLARQSQALIADNIDRLGLADMAKRPAGCVQMFDNISTAQRQKLAFASAGISCEIIQDAARSFDRPALFFPNDRSGDARAYGEALERDLIHRDAYIIYGAKNIQIRQDADGLTVASGSNRFRPDHVIIAAGAQSGSLLAQLGLSIDIIGVRGHAVNFKAPNMDLPEIPVMDVASRSALSLFGKTLRLSGGWNNQDAAPMLQRWQDIAPQMTAALGDPTSTWEAMRPVSKAGRPFIDGTSIPGLWVNAGHGHMGWTLCAGSGALMAEMILDGARNSRFAYTG
ncbi:NAD(P)/FAD-dependent oxidoreductase [Litorimonas sp. RW-G-Af-16]|uniref:NAD(P)/FAD-dependent oxidoreductase n=1 Tax=Litorimonas sp. RW-G-Af-16 TaxID=3241168 RepID=UPI00390C78A8